LATSQIRAVVLRLALVMIAALSGCAAMPDGTAAGQSGVAIDRPPAVSVAPAQSASLEAPDPTATTASGIPVRSASLKPASATTTGDAMSAMADAVHDDTGRHDASRHDDLWQRIRVGFAMPALETPLVAERERGYLANPEALQRMFARGGRYLYFIVEELEKRGMPTELALLPFVESAMNPVALSPAKASGLWQFIPATGKRYELSQNWWVDNRRDVVKSTHAALEYLQAIHEMHGRDWFLALASYNWGENAVARAVQRNRAAGQPADYLNLRMPNETRLYVPKLIALKNILLRADELGLQLPPVPNEPYFATVEKTRPIDLKLAARFAGMGVDEFVALNPAHNRPVIAATRNNLIRLPADRVEGFLDAMRQHGASGKPLASWQPYTLQRGESLDEVARRVGVTAAEVLDANGLNRSARVLAGTRLLVPQRTVTDESQVEAFNGPRVYEEVRQPEIVHVVRARETLAMIARRYKVSIDQIRRLNDLQDPKTALAPGTRLLVQRAATQIVLTTESGLQRVVPPETAQRAAAPRQAEPARPASAPAQSARPAQPSSQAQSARPPQLPRPPAVSQKPAPKG